MNTISFIALGISALAIVLNYLQFRDTHRETKRIRQEHIDTITNDVMDACFHVYNFVTPPPQIQLVMEQARNRIIARLKQEI